MPQVTFRITESEKEELDDALYARGKLSVQQVFHGLMVNWINNGGPRVKPGQVEIDHPEGDQLAELVRKMSALTERVEEIAKRARKK